MQYYDHADHLGSSSYITNLDAQIVQHVAYVPFGEMFIEERNQSWNTPYLFNGKELDEETGLYYYGARYYNPRESIFLSVDPMFEETMTPYQYTYQNPIRFTDPTGMIPEVSGDPPKWLSKIIRKINSIKTNTTRWYFNNVVATQLNWSPANTPFDTRGYELFFYWVNGLGKEGGLRYKEGKWGDYMRNNTYIKDFLKDQAYGEALSMKNRGQNTSTISPYKTPMEIENGYTTGYELLHGTSDFQVKGGTGVYNEKTGVYTFKYNLLWNDRIDPNVNQGDGPLADFIKKTPGINPVDYNISIEWSQTVDIKLDSNKKNIQRPEPARRGSREIF